MFLNYRNSNFANKNVTSPIIHLNDKIIIIFIKIRILTKYIALAGSDGFHWEKSGKILVKLDCSTERALFFKSTNRKRGSQLSDNRKVSVKWITVCPLALHILTYSH